MSRTDDGDKPQFDHAPSETNWHTRKAALISGLGKVPDSYQRQNRCNNHEQTDRSPLCFWILHILLLEVGARERVDRPENAWASVRSRLPTFAYRQALLGPLLVRAFDFARNSILR
jgi:hypothetical protein